MLQQMIRAARLDRTLYTEIFFDSYATGNAVLLVAGIYAAVYVGMVVGLGISFSVPSFISVMLGGLVGWLIVAGGLWLAGTKVFEGMARGATVIRLSGFAHTPLLLLVAAALLGRPFSQILVAIALAWFVAALAMAARVLFDLDSRQAVAAALLAVAVWWVVQWLGIGADLARVVRFF
jgi:hypothetical protein